MAQGPMRSVHEHLQAVLGDLSPRAPEPTAVDETIGLAVAERVVSDFPLPPFTSSAMDGYAVRLADVDALPATLPVPVDLPAGSALAVRLAPGVAHRIMTGATVPEGADAVIPVEWTDAGAHNVVIEHLSVAAAPGLNIRPQGDDLPKGAILADVGDVVEAPRLALMASAGISSVAAFPAPRVAVVSTGDELHPLGKPLPPGGIYGSHGYRTAALAAQAGGRVAHRVRLTDDEQPATEILESIASEVDLIVTTGGVSAGAYEVIKDVFAKLGTAEFTAVAMQPGKPQGHGTIAGTPVITLPGNPLSAMVSFHIFVGPAIRALGGHREVMAPRARLSTAVGLDPRPDRVRYLPAVADLLRQTVSTPPRHGSHRSSVAVGTNCLIEVPVGQAQMMAGTEVEVVLFPAR